MPRRVGARLVVVSKRRKAPTTRRRRSSQRPGHGLDVSYECANCGAEISAAPGAPGSTVCPVCEHPRNAAKARDELADAAAAHRQSLRRITEAFAAASASGRGPADVARATGLPVTTARRWLQQGPRDPWKGTQWQPTGR